MKKIAERLCCVFFVLVLGYSGYSGYSGSNNQEAKKLGLLELDKYVVKCGDNFSFSMGDSNFVQYTKAKISVKETTSDADHLNGIDWNGEVKVSFSGSVRYYSKGRWSAWGEDEDEAFRIRNRWAVVQKSKDGQWASGIDFIRYPITCSDVPK